MLLICGLVLLYTQVVFATKPQNVTLGGLFSIFDEQNNFDESQLQRFSGFLMAIDEINRRTDLLPNTTINFILKSSSTNFKKACLDASDLAPVISAAVSALPSVEVAAIDQVFTETKTVMAHSYASDTQFGDGSVFQYKLQTCPIDSFQGMALQHMMCNYFNYSRVVIFANNDEFGNKATVESGDGTYCAIDNLGTFMFPSYTTDFSSYISSARELQASVFLLFMTPQNAAMLLEQGYNMGLFREGTQILGPSNLLTPNLYSYFTPTADIPSILKGVILIQFWPSYYIDTLGSKLSFVDSFRSLPVTLNNCSDNADSNGFHYLFPNGDTSTSCRGLNYSTFNVNGTDIDPYVSLTYDATYLIAHGLHVVIDNGWEVNGDNLLKAVFNNVSFVGVSGLVESYEGMASFGYYARGDREVGHHYRIMNFNADAYALNSNESFVQVMVWSVEDGVQPCDEITRCSDVIYNTPDNSIPSSFPPYTFADPPTTIKIGGLFSPVDELGHFDVVEAENLAAFLMAINEINNKTDGIADDLLPNTQLRIAVETGRGFDGAVSSAEMLLESFFSTGVAAVVCGLPNMETMATDQLLGDHKIVQAHSMAADTNLGTGSQFPYKIQTCPIDSFQGMALQNIVCNYFLYSKVTIFATNDVFGSKTAMEAVDGTYCEISVLSTHLFRSDIVDFSSIIDSAQQAGAQVFFMFMGPQNAANLLEQGYDMGLFHEGTQIFTSNYTLTSDLYKYFSEEADVPEIMKGLIGIQYWPNYSEVRTPVGRRFLDNWRHQKYTGRKENGHCDITQDDALSSYLYTSQSNQSFCAGLNFSSYDSNGTMMNPYAGLTYDATYLIAHGLHVVIDNGWEVNGDNLLKAVFNNVSFVGVSGLVESYEGMASFGYYARGDREVGHHYRIMNFNADAYALNSNESFVQVMVWSVEDGVQPCDEITRCSDVIYNTPDNLPALDTPPDIVITLTGGESGVMFALGAIVLLVVVLSSYYMYFFWKSKLIKASQPSILFLLLLGGLLAAIRVIVGGVSISDSTCIANEWFGHLAFVIIIGCLYGKVYRLDRIFNTVQSGSKSSKFSKRNLLTLVLVLIGFQIVYLIVLTFAGIPHKSATSSVKSNQTTLQIRCSLKYPQFETALLSIETAFAIYALKTSWAIKDFPDIINEGKYIASALSFVVMIGALVFPIEFVLPLSPNVLQVIAAASIAMGACSTLIVFFFPKYFRLYAGDDLRGKNSKGASGDEKGAKGTLVSDMKKDASIAPTNPGSGADPNAIVLASAALHKLSADEKVQLCQDQISKWRGMMVQICEKNSGQSGSNSNTSSSRPGMSSTVLDEGGRGRLNTMTVDHELKVSNFEAE